MKPSWVPSRKVARRRRGAAVVEAAVVLPVVLLFFLGIFEYGRYVMTRQVLTNAAREGARYALAHTEPVTIQGKGTLGNATADVQNIVNNFSGGQKLTGQQIDVYKSDVNGNSQGSWNDAAAGELICVRITGTYNFVIPQLLYLPSSMSFTGSQAIRSVMRSEGN